MKYIGVVTEFNPFHNGHKFLFEQIKNIYPDASIVCVMSGNFCQRGEIALFDKYGIDYVSCSPFRVPGARLAAAQAEVRDEGYQY